jgi:HAMP domain-containing protein
MYLATLLMIALVPLAVVGYFLINASSQALTEQMESYILRLAEAKAEEIELKLEQVQSHTQIATQATALVLQLQIPLQTLEARMASYQMDGRGVWGLPEENYAARRALFPEGVISNIFVGPYVELTPEFQEDIVTTESLEVILSGIKEANLNTRRVYLTTVEGLMRVYPWVDNESYPADWDPREAIFFAAATPANNPSRHPVWTSSYLDADDVWMVTVSIPVYDSQDNFLAVVSQDVAITSLMQLVLDLNLPGDTGYGFLIDHEGKVIAHPDPDYIGTNLMDTTNIQLEPVVTQMMNRTNGVTYFEDGNDPQSVAFARIPNTAWSLAIVVPQRAVIAPAQAMRQYAIGLSLAVAIAVTGVAFLLSRQVTNPLAQLMQGVERIGQGDWSYQIALSLTNEMGRLAEAFNAMTNRLGVREQSLQRQIAAMRIEIDETKKNYQVNRITETEYFRQLQRNARYMRAMLEGERE